MALTADVVIIGGGVTGTSIAFDLVSRGVRDVLLVDKGVIAAGGCNPVETAQGFARVGAMVGVEIPITVCRHKISIVTWPAEARSRQ